MKKRLERRKHCALAVVIRQRQKFSPRRRPLPGGAGRRKFNQLEMVTIPSPRQTQSVEDRYTQFRVIVVTDSHTNKPTDRTNYNTLRR